MSNRVDRVVCENGIAEYIDGSVLYTRKDTREASMVDATDFHVSLPIKGNLVAIARAIDNAGDAVKFGQAVQDALQAALSGILRLPALGKRSKLERLLERSTAFSSAPCIVAVDLDALVEQVKAVCPESRELNEHDLRIGAPYHKGADGWRRDVIAVLLDKYSTPRAPAPAAGASETTSD